MDSLFITLQKLLPQHALSRLTGWLAEVEWIWLKNFLISLFIGQYDVNMDEAVHHDASGYKNFNEFFTRPLQEGARPLADSSQFILSPADGVISQLGPIESGRIFQAKGQSYTVSELLGGGGEVAETFSAGSFATIYLSPKDYHRVHQAIDGTLLSAHYIPGELFSVNEVTAQNVPGLFARNERLVCIFDTEVGEVAVVLVGAMIVAGIETVWGGRMKPGVDNRFRPESDSIKLQAGDELGRFYLGSTVILLFKPGAVDWNDELKAGSPLKMGEGIARLGG